MKLSFCVVLAFAMAQTSPGRVVNALDFGADRGGLKPASAAITRAVSAAKDGDTVLVPRGRYRLDRRIAAHGRCSLTLCGEPGTVLVMHCNPEGPEDESSGGILVGESENVVIEGFTITTDNPIGSSGRVIRFDAVAHTVDVRLDPWCLATGREHLFQIDTCDEEGTPDRAVEANERIHEVRGTDGSVRHVGMRYSVLGDHTIRVCVPKWAPMSSVTNGHRVLFRYFRDGGSALYLGDVRGALIRDVEIERTPSTGIVIAPRSSDITFRRFNIRMAKDDPALAASNSDGIHFIGCAGSVVLEDCHFKGLGDDALNIHSLAGEVQAFDPGSGLLHLVWRGPDRKAKSLSRAWGSAGDRIAVYDARTFRARGTLVLGEPVGDGGWTCDPKDVALSPGDIVANTRNYPDARITGCTVENTRARAFLLQTRRIRVENCRFRGFPSCALLIAADIKTWNEMGPTEDAEIRDCVFEKCSFGYNAGAFGAVLVRLSHGWSRSGYPAGAHRNVRISGNSFSRNGGGSIYAEAVDGLRIEDNCFAEGIEKASLPPECRYDVQLHNCANVVVRGNRTDRGEARMLTSDCGIRQELHVINKGSP